MEENKICKNTGALFLMIDYNENENDNEKKVIWIRDK